MALASGPSGEVPRFTVSTGTDLFVVAVGGRVKQTELLGRTLLPDGRPVHPTCTADPTFSVTTDIVARLCGGLLSPS